MDSETIYSCLSNHYDLIYTVDHKILKYPLTWYWRHVKDHQDDQTVTLDRWFSLNVECDSAANQKWKEDQKSGFPKLQSHNIQYENWKLFTNTPTNTYGKRYTDLGNKVSTNLKDSIDNATFNKPLLALWHKIDTLHESSQTIIYWEALKLATKKVPTRQLRWAARLASK